MSLAVGFAWKEMLVAFGWKEMLVAFNWKEILVAFGWKEIKKAFFVSNLVFYQLLVIISLGAKESCLLILAHLESMVVD